MCESPPSTAVALQLIIPLSTLGPASLFGQIQAKPRIGIILAQLQLRCLHRHTKHQGGAVN